MVMPGYHCSGPWRGTDCLCSHDQALRHARLIWKYLFSLMYGHRVELGKPRDWRKQLALVATLAVYADALDLN